MKIKFLMAGLLGVASTTAFAQKGELSSAKEKFETYVKQSNDAAKEADKTKSNLMYSLADKNFVEAKTSIDKAAKNEKTAQLPQTFAVKAAIYATFAMRDTAEAKTLPYYTEASEALKKAQELDTNGENKALITEAVRNLSQYQLNKGVTSFQAKQYDAAYKAFDTYRQLSPTDTNAIYYSGLAAIQSGNFPNAVKAYNDLLPLEFSKKETIYLDLSSIYLFNLKDTANAIKTVTAGIEKLPNSSELRKREIELSLQSGKGKEIIGKIEAAIANDPKNKNLYYYAGLVYTTFANGITADMDKLKATSGKDLKTSQLPAFLTKLDPLVAKKDGYTKKAIENYQKALELDPGYFEANLNMGFAQLSPAIDYYNYANNYLPATKQKEYNAMIAKSAAQAEVAKPFLVKATELQPKNADAWRNLKNYYLATKNTAEANNVQKTIDGLQK